MHKVPNRHLLAPLLPLTLSFGIRSCKTLHLVQCICQDSNATGIMEWDDGHQLQPMQDDQPMAYNDGGEALPEEEGDEVMDIDEIPVTQEDAWAVIRYVLGPRR